MNPRELSAQLETYLSLRSAIGYCSQAEIRLWDFVRFVEAKDYRGPITAQLALDWVCCRPGSGPSGRARRLSLVRRFLAHVRLSFPDTEVPGARMVASPRRQNPYIYSQFEIEQLLEAALTLRPRNSLRPQTFRTLIGLLVSTGLRVGEALRLTTTNVLLDADPPLILVSQTKFHKSRIVPVHSTTGQELRAYNQKRESCGFKQAFFVSHQGRPWDRMRVWRAFSTLLQHVGIRPTSDGRRPTVHGLRHTFAVNRMLAWYQEGLDVKMWLPHLSVYLGHAEPKDTYWYLTATPELLHFAADYFERYAQEGGAQ